MLTNNKKSLAVRFPKHTIFKDLLKQLDYPLAAPSANITTKVSAVKAKDVKEEFGNKIKYILDGGTCTIGIESTIVNLIGRPDYTKIGRSRYFKNSKNFRF